jgi:glycine cleavage system H protein
MTVILVLFTLIVFLTADYFVQRARTARAREFLLQESPVSFDIPPGVRLARNHTWVTGEDKGIVTVGLDEFLGKIVGAADRILLPQPGDMLRPALASITLSAGRGRLPLSAPVGGRVVAVNGDLTGCPALARTDPYRKGWLMKIEVDRQARPASALVEVSKAGTWLREQLALAKEFFTGLPSQAGLATMQDGGLASEGILKNYGEEVWTEFRERFAPPLDEGRPVPTVQSHR